MAKKKRYSNSWLRDIAARRRSHAAKLGAWTKAANKKKLRSKSCSYIAETGSGPLGIFKSYEKAVKRCKKASGKNRDVRFGGCRVVKSCIQMR